MAVDMLAAQRIARAALKKAEEYPDANIRDLARELWEQNGEPCQYLLVEDWLEIFTIEERKPCLNVAAMKY